MTAPKRDHQTEDFHLRLPPLPEWPGQRCVIDIRKPEDLKTNRGIPGENLEFHVAGRLVAVFQGEEPDPIPPRVERALHVALSCCDTQTGECNGLEAARVWRDSR